MKPLLKAKKKKKPITVTRLNILFFIIFILFAVIIFRLAFVQLINGDEYSELAEYTRTKTIPISAPRGLIKDANNVVLASNETVWTITFEINDEIEQDFDGIATILASLLAETEEELEEKKDEILKNMDVGPYFRASKYIPRVIQIDIDEKARAYIEEHLADLPGVTVMADQIRNYVYNTFMAQTIGYTRVISDSQLDYYQALNYKPTDRVGAYGLEKEYETVLHGADGEYVVEVDSDYSTVEQKSEENPVPGNNLILTIDMNFQKAVEKSLEKVVKGLQEKTEDVTLATAVVMDPNDGAVLAMANYPSYDPNWYNGPISQEFYDKNIVLYEANTAIRGRYAIGSTAKPLTVSMALEEGIIAANTVVNDRGRIAYGYDYKGDTIYMKNYGGRAFGLITLSKALKYSSNVYMTEIALRMVKQRGIDTTLETMRYYDNMFGLGTMTGIDLPEELSGYISRNKNYVQHSIGQDDTFTCIQLAQYVSTIANDGYKMEPYLVKEIEEGSSMGGSGKIIYEHDPKVLNKVDVSLENLKLVQGGMKEVTERGGTAYYYFTGLPMEVAAKTGTAEAPDKRKNDHSIIMGYAPYDDPQVAFAVIVPYGAGNGASSGQVARDILEGYIDIYLQ